MLSSYIERREKFLHGRDTNRKSLPFEWGLEHLGLAANGNSAAAIHKYATEALNNSPAFYSCAPATDYEFNGGILKFPSAIKTPYSGKQHGIWPRLRCREEILRSLFYRSGTANGTDRSSYAAILQRAGIGSVRLSMPYHHYRKPAELERSEYLISSNIGRTIAATRQAVLDAQRTVDWLLRPRLSPCRSRRNKYWVVRRLSCIRARRAAFNRRLHSCVEFLC